MKEYRELREQICDVCHKMWQKGWVAANDGNVSVRLEDGTFLATPTGMSKSFITPEKLVHIDKDGKVLDGEQGLRPSSEIKMHLRSFLLSLNEQFHKKYTPSLSLHLILLHLLHQHENLHKIQSQQLENLQHALFSS